MRRILVISDSHGVNENVRKAIDKAKSKYGELHAMFHLGDVGADYPEVERMAGVPTYIVAGNCDYSNELKKRVIITMGRHKIYAAHGHIEGVNFGLDFLRYKALENECDIALFGHIHIPVYDEGDVTIINPGSISRPRQEDKKKTFAILELDDDEGIECRFDSID